MGFDWKRAAGLPPMDASYGAVPSYKRITRLRNYTLIEPRGVHINPRFFKYRWRIWALDNTDPDWAPEYDDRAAGGRLFDRRSQPVASLSFADAIRRMQVLAAQRAYFYALMSDLKRADPAAPWQPGVCAAPAYDDDMDEPFHGHK